MRDFDFKLLGEEERKEKEEEKEGEEENAARGIERYMQPSTYLNIPGGFARSTILIKMHDCSRASPQRYDRRAGILVHIFRIIESSAPVMQRPTLIRIFSTTR